MKFEDVIKAAYGIRFTRKKWGLDIWITQFKLQVLLGIPQDAKVHEYEFFGRNDIRQFELPAMFLQCLKPFKSKSHLFPWQPTQEDALANDWIEITPKMDEVIEVAKYNGNLPDEAPGDDWQLVKLNSIDDLDNIQHLMHSKYADMLNDENTRETLKSDIEVGCKFIFWIEERKIIFER